MKRLAVLAVLMATLGSLSRGYQNGAPKDACVSMFPQHQAEAQTSLSPYNITLSSATYTPGSNDTVAVFLTSAQQQTFAGVLVEARSAADCGNTNPLGTFLLATSERDLQLLSCTAAGVSCVAADITDTVATHRIKDAVTQKKSLHKTTSKVFLWHPPVHSTGPVYFRATVVKSKTVFWTSVTSSVLSDTTQRSNVSLLSPPCSSQTTATTTSITITAAAATITTNNSTTITSAAATSSSATTTTNSITTTTTTSAATITTKRITTTAATITTTTTTSAAANTTTAAATTTSAAANTTTAAATTTTAAASATSTQIPLMSVILAVALLFAV